MMTVMGEALVDGLSDAGSTPARSTMKTAVLLRYGGFLRIFHTKNIFLCYDIKNDINIGYYRQ